MTRSWAAVVLTCAALAAAACGRRDAPHPADPAGTALALFDAARRDPLVERELSGIVEAEFPPGGRAGLYDAVAALGRTSSPEPLKTALLDNGDRAAVEVRATLAGGGRGTYTVVSRRTAEGGWRVVAFWGPGVSWPERAPPGAEGLSVSPPAR